MIVNFDCNALMIGERLELGVMIDVETVLLNNLKQSFCNTSIAVTDHYYVSRNYETNNTKGEGPILPHVTLFINNGSPNEG